MNGNFGVTTGGRLYAKGAYVDGSGVFTGTITANDGTIGGWHITSNAIYSGSATASSNSNGDVRLATANFSRPIASGVDSNDNVTYTNRENLRFAIGQNFGVSTTGTLYAYNVNIAGKITATSGAISGSLVTSGINAGNITAGTIAVARLNVDGIAGQ